MSSEVRTRTRDAVLVDVVRENAVDRELRSARRHRAWRIALAAAGAVVVYLTWLVNVDRPADYASADEHFKYGSIGSEPGGSIGGAMGGLLPPYEIFRVLPQVCP